MEGLYPQYPWIRTLLGNKRARWRTDAIATNFFLQILGRKLGITSNDGWATVSVKQVYKFERCCFLITIQIREAGGGSCLAAFNNRYKSQTDQNELVLNEEEGRGGEESSSSLLKG
jgi:hypothetical protein